MPFEKIEDILQGKRWPSDPRRPSWYDFRDQRIPIQQPQFDNVMQCLEEQRIALLVGPANRGKTFLTYAIGYHATENRKWKVRYAKAPDVSFKDDIEDMKERHTFRRTETLYIIDDCHSLPNDANRFLEWALRAGDGACHFLFIMRSLSYYGLTEPFSILKQRKCAFSLIPSMSFLKSLIAAYIDFLKEQNVNLIQLSYTDEYLERFIREKVGSDIDRLMRFLTQGWNPANQDLGDASETPVLHSIWQNYRLDIVGRRELLSVLSSLQQFDVKVWAPYLENLTYSALIEELVTEGHVKTTMSGSPPLRFMGLAGAKDAEYILKVVAKDQQIDPKQYTYQRIKDYVRSKPPNIIPLINTLFESGEKVAIKEVFGDRDAMKALQEDLRKRSFKSIDRVANKLEIVYGPLSGSLLSHDELCDKLQKGSKGGAIWRIQHALCILHGAESKRKFFSDWTSADYLSTIDSARRLGTLKILFYTLELSGLADVEAKFAEQLPNAQLQRLLDPADGTTLVELNKLVGNLRCVPKQLGPFLHKLSVTDLDETIKNAEANAVRWLLWQMLLYAPTCVSAFANGHTKSLARLISRSQLSEAFWICWNIFQADKQSASIIVLEVQAAAPQLLESISSAEALTTGLAWIALLDLCGIESTVHYSPKTRLEQIKDAINNETDVSLSALSLKALTLMLSNTDLSSLKKDLDLKGVYSSVNDFPVDTTRQLLREIVNEFESVALI